MKSSNKRILIVDDNVAIHDDFKRLLTQSASRDSSLDHLEASLFGESVKERPQVRSQDYTVDSAFQGMDAVQLVQKSQDEQSPYAVAFVDMRMPPGIDGLETIRRIWATSPFTEIVLCTAYSDHSLSEISEYLGDTQRLLLLKKPFDPVEIRQMAASLTAKWNYAFDARYYLENLENLLNERTKCLDEERALRIQASKLAALGEMAGGIAHEINNPLGIIAGNASRLMKMVKRSQLEEDKIIEVSDKILETSNRISRIIQSMLSVSHQNMQLEHQKHKLKMMLQDCMDICHEKFKSRGIELEVQEIPEDWAIECDYTKIVQIFINLLNNAHDALIELDKPEKAVHVTIEDIGDMFEIRFIDSGEGIPVEIADKILQPFFTTKDVGKGTGLGLSLAQSYVRDHAGDFELDMNNPNTCFVLRFHKVIPHPEPRAEKVN
ncbi:hybrid sensor histidine kinase/response regulator [Pseudobacteriovorax antillogorgiicola]|uniref:histidine kinase n=1 Tax=Pseudobacteriovorax antillogorgiicola TaxID=1513793 RepID=A0A1Y6CJX7_9BACT|nr:hybrid sensor histidine kinase/response regulator [Pseudobacteriovorax antillogorgiicola]TCS48339.1 response regulator receiver domain-containing protein [Pseudobacteriovorax antillogorgiicola]SMF56387.1 Response regulator receiver domain-containing protein [Pseudobacteriovorax antillogorgiicola]